MSAADDEGDAAARGIARFLALAATPACATMALMTAVRGEGAMDLLCAALPGPALSGMVPMYLLMSALHSAPWLKLIAGSSKARVAR